MRRTFRSWRALRLRGSHGAGSGSERSRHGSTTGDRGRSRARTHAGAYARRMTGARYETCRECGLEWNVSKQAAIPWSGYLCPICRGKIRKEAQARESSPEKNSGSRGRRLRRDPFSPI